VTAGALSFNQSNFQVPAGYVGVTFQQYSGAVVPETSISGGPLGHFVFTAEKGPSQAVPPYCSPLLVASPVRVHGSVTTLYQCANSGTSPGENELVLGHDLLMWHNGGLGHRSRRCHPAGRAIKALNSDSSEPRERLGRSPEVLIGGRQLSLALSQNLSRRCRASPSSYSACKAQAIQPRPCNDKVQVLPGLRSVHPLTEKGPSDQSSSSTPLIWEGQVGQVGR
jgi:hypothetical protein